MDAGSMRSLQIRNWRLSYKLAVVLVVPLLAAGALGALRVSTQLTEARRFSSLSEQVAVVPALLDLARVVVNASVVTSTGMTQVQPEQAPDSTAHVRALADSSNLAPEIAENLTVLLEDGEALGSATQGGGLSPAERSQRMSDFLVRCEATIRTLLDLTENTEVLTAGSDLFNTWSAQRTMVDQMNAFFSMTEDSDATHLTAENAMNSEQSKLSLLQGTPVDRGQISGMLESIAARRVLTENFKDDVGSLGQLQKALLSSAQPYRDVMLAASGQVTDTLDRLTAEARSAALRDSIIVVSILAAALAVTLLVARSLSIPIRRLRDGTLSAARHELPAAIAAIKDGADVSSVALAPIDVHTDEEIGELARAVDSVNSEALHLAGEQAHLRQQVAVMLETLARRNKTLVEQQLSLIDSLEYDEKDPARLQSLYALDHLAARMRRTGDSLLVLAGTRSRTRGAPAPLGDVLRGAVSQVENYQRVRIGHIPHGSLVGAAVTDVVHLVAELVDNALRASPPDSGVTFTFSPAVDNGLLLEISDCGIGVPPATLDSINSRLTAGDNAQISAPRQMGLFVVGRLAARNGISVHLRPTFDSGTNAGITASLYFPASLLDGVHYSAPEFTMDRPRRLRLPDEYAPIDS